MGQLSQVWDRIQGTLLPFLLEELDPITEKQEKLICILEMIRAEDFIKGPRLGARGRPPSDRQALVRAFVAKAYYNMTTTDELIERLNSSKNLRRICGWERRDEIPDESTFSRSFSEFSQVRLPEIIHENLVKVYQSERLVGHICRDSTEISAREKPVPKPVGAKKAKTGRARKGEAIPRIGAVEAQLQMSLHEQLQSLPAVCDRGAKTNSKGNLHYWTGYKLHIDTADGEVPISCVLTSASVCDVRVALPLMAITAKRVTSLYDLMDKAYECRFIEEESIRLGHVPIIDHKRRPSEKTAVEMDPAKKQRYKIRTTVERVNSRLKDDFGGRHVRVRGVQKVMAHLMFGILVLTADQLLKLVT